eukprot:CCRYP_019281-RB/>CCRYP_019281-RB protein AED:0.07 eAED:0.07 QI:0/0/0/1/0/0/3/0/419
MKFGSSDEHDKTDVRKGSDDNDNNVSIKEKEGNSAADASLNESIGTSEIPQKTSKRKGQPTKLDPEKAGIPGFSYSRHDDEDSNACIQNISNDHCEDSEEEEDESEHQAAILASLLDKMADFLRSPLCKSIIVLAGAGMSVSSGIPDFRSAGVGLYDTLQAELLTASELERQLIAEDPTLALDKGMFLRNPLPMLELKRDFILGTQESRWKATLAHRFVEMLHTKLGKLTRLYTQNIDGLELQCKGLPKEKVVNVHGSMGRAACELCEAEVDFDEFCAKIRSVCEACGRPTVKPTIVLFRGSMPKEFHDKTAEDLIDCDLLIIMGTSLTVSPANSLVYRIPPTCLRLVINNQRVGRMLGIDYSESSIRDVFAHGHSDAMCLDLIDKLGWLDDLAAIIEELPESNVSLLRKRLAQKAISS